METIKTSPNARFEFFAIATKKGIQSNVVVMSNSIDAAKRAAIKNGYKVESIYPK